MIMFVISFTILRKHYHHPSNSKTMTKFSYGDNVDENLLSVRFSKVVSLGTLADANRLQDEVSVNFVGNKGLALELSANLFLKG